MNTTGNSGGDKKEGRHRGRFIHREICGLLSWSDMTSWHLICNAGVIVWHQVSFMPLLNTTSVTICVLHLGCAIDFHRILPGTGTVGPMMLLLSQFYSAQEEQTHTSRGGGCYSTLSLSKSMLDQAEVKPSPKGKSIWEGKATYLVRWEMHKRAWSAKKEEVHHENIFSTNPTWDITAEQFKLCRCL